jgi:Tol biopolymer transport system component
MSPEQLQGQEGDARSDIFAFGAVLYEMLTGRRAFAGDSAASVIASIIGQEPAPISSVEQPGLEHLVNKCMAKDPEQRWQSAADLRDELLWLPDLKPAAAAATRNRRVFWPWAIAAICAALALFAWMRRAPPEHRLTRVAVNAPEGTQVTGFGSAISPNGRMVVFAGSAHGVRQLWLRSLEEAQARSLRTTEGAQFPFWSPNSQSIGFFAGGRLKRIDLSTGIVRSICPAPNGTGGTWNSDNVIVFAPYVTSTLQSVSASGGTSVRATARNPTRRDSHHNYPQFLPDGKRFLVFVRADPSQTGTYVGALGKPDELIPLRELLGISYRTIYAPSNHSQDGYIIFVRDQQLWAQAFDPRRLHFTGEPIPLALRDNYAAGGMPGISNFLNISASQDGSILDGGSQDLAVQVVWKDRQARLLEVVDKAGQLIAPELSPNTSEVVFSRPDAKTGIFDVWLMDLRRRSFSKFTFGTSRDIYPVWSPDGSRLVFSSDRAGPESLYMQAASGVTEPVRLETGQGNYVPSSWSPDGRFICYTQTNVEDGGDIWMAPVDRPQAAFPFIKTAAREGQGRFSPDGRWVAYYSEESGTGQIYVRRFRDRPAAEAKWQISTTGGIQPRWRRDGKEIYFLSPEGKMMTAGVRLGAETLQSDPAHELFDFRPGSVFWTRYQYDVSPDGKKFLLVSSVEERQANSMTLLLNWEKALAR